MRLDAFTFISRLHFYAYAIFRHGMTKALDHPVLHKAIGSLNVSAEFKLMAKANQFNTLEDVLKEPLDGLPFKKLSGYRMLRELLTVLEQHGLHELMED